MPTPVDRCFAAAEHDGKTQLVDRYLDELDYSKLTRADQEEWHVLRIAAAFRRAERPLAFERAQAARDAFPKSAKVAFALGQEYEHRGQPDQMSECFSRACFPSVSGNTAMAMARYAYLWEKPEDGLKHLRPLLAAYKRLRIADDMFLYLRGLPFLADAMNAVLCLCQQADNLAEADRALRRICPATSEWGAEEFEQLAGLQLHASPEAVATHLVHGLRRSRPDGPFHGLPGLRWAAWAARSAPSVAAADSLLDSVSLEATQPSWLDHIVMVCKAEARHRLGDPTEIEHAAPFRAAQPLLFEPHHAFAFGISGYQRLLAIGYREQRTANGNR
jgi:tetratricopeptide (TPR) repeat protein